MIKTQFTGFLNTPPIWKDEQFDIQQFEFPKLDLQQFEPKPLPGNLRLGHQMEYVFKQLIEYSDAYEILLYNLPIREEKRTLGEIDFILNEKKTGRLIHVELTYKFYLIDPDISEPIHSLIGPNRRDLFFTKMEKIKNVQYPLLHSEEGAKALSEHNIDHSQLEHQCCFKAQIFQPFGSKTVDFGVLNKNCLAGYWLPFEDFKKAEFFNAKFYMPTKSEWVIEPHDQLNWKSHFEIMIDTRKRLVQKYAPMLWMKKTENEFEKFFVVWW